MAAFLIPAANNARERGRRAMCANNLRQLVVGMTMYADDHDGYPVRVEDHIIRTQIPSKNWYTRSTYSLWVPPQTPVGAAYLYEGGYIDDLDIFYCPVSEVD